MVDIEESLRSINALKTSAKLFNVSDGAGTSFYCAISIQLYLYILSIYSFTSLTIYLPSNVSIYILFFSNLYLSIYLQKRFVPADFSTRTIVFSIYPYINLRLYLTIFSYSYLFFRLYLSLLSFLTIFSYPYLSIHLSIYLYIYLFTCRSGSYLRAYLAITSLSICLSIHSSTSLFILLFIYLILVYYLSIYLLSIYLSIIYLSIY